MRRTRLTMTQGRTIEEGEELFAAGDLAGACEVFEEILKTEPSNPRALNNLGAVCHAQGRKEEAACCFELALAAEPRNETTVLNLFGIYLDLSRLEDAARLVGGYHGLLSHAAHDELEAELARLRAASDLPPG